MHPAEGLLTNIYPNSVSQAFAVFLVNCFRLQTLLIQNDGTVYQNCVLKLCSQRFGFICF